MEIIADKRLVGESWVKDGKWSLDGKMFGSGPTMISARVVGEKGKSSPARHFSVHGFAKQTLSLNLPAEGDYIQAGKITLKGTGKPGDNLVVLYSDVVIANATAGKNGKWSKIVKVSEPRKQAYFKVISKSEAETVTALVRSSD